MSRELLNKDSSGNDSKLGKDAKGERETVSLARRSRLARKLINAIYRPFIYCALLTIERGRMFKDPELRRFIFDREARTGLLEDSIIGDELYVPNEDETSLECKSIAAGCQVPIFLRQVSTTFPVIV